LLERVDSRIYSEDDLRRWVTAPVLATVPPLTTAAEQKSHAWLRGVEIAFASALLAIIPALTFLVYLKG